MTECVNCGLEIEDTSLRPDIGACWHTLDGRHLCPRPDKTRPVEERWQHFPAPIEEGFEGHQPRDCGEHRTTGGRAWCIPCSEWCYPHDGCHGCQAPRTRAEIAGLRAVLDPGNADALNVVARVMLDRPLTARYRLAAEILAALQKLAPEAT